MLQDFLSKFFMCVKFCQIQWKYKNILIFFERGIKTIGNGWKSWKKIDNDKSKKLDPGSEMFCKEDLKTFLFPLRSLH